VTQQQRCTATDARRITAFRLATPQDHAVADLMRWWELITFALGSATIELADLESCRRWTLARYLATSGHWYVLAVGDDTPQTFALQPGAPDHIEALQHHGLDTRPIEIALAELERWLTAGDAVNDSPPLRAA